jgi:hypothetical protein
VRLESLAQAVNLAVVMEAAVLWAHPQMAAAARAEMAECQGVAEVRVQELTLARLVVREVQGVVAKLESLVGR